MTWRTKILTRRGGLGEVTPPLHSPAGPLFWGVVGGLFGGLCYGGTPPPYLGIFEWAAFSPSGRGRVETVFWDTLSPDGT
eukprot:8418744-Pyramimonas_sp.AAC.1